MTSSDAETDLKPIIIIIASKDHKKWKVNHHASSKDALVTPWVNNKYKQYNINIIQTIQYKKGQILLRDTQ